MSTKTPLFGQRVRELREARKRTDMSFSLRSFAKKVGISPTFLSKIETGALDPPAPDKIINIANALGINADELLTMARKIDPELKEIIHEEPVAVADLLRTARGLSAEELNAITQRIREERTDS